MINKHIQLLIEKNKNKNTKTKTMESQVLERTQIFWSLCAWLGSSAAEVWESVKYYKNTLRTIYPWIASLPVPVCRMHSGNKQETVLRFNCVVIKLGNVTLTAQITSQSQVECARRPGLMHSILHAVRFSRTFYVKASSRRARVLTTQPDHV